MNMRCMTSLCLWQDGRVLLLHRRGGRVADGLWIGSAGGHMEPHELGDPLACVLRETREELGLAPDGLRGLALRYVTLRRAGDELRQNCFFFAELPHGAEPAASAEGELRWFRPEEIAALPMPASFRSVMAHYLALGRHTGAVYGGVGGADGFTFAELTP